jgi:hypothetical protein
MEEKPYPKPEISKTRKILICAFMIGFWVFFYWYHHPERTPKTTKTSDQEMQNINSLAEKTEDK